MNQSGEDQSKSMGDSEEEIRTPLTEIILCLKELAAETNLLYIMDVEALVKLAALNHLQQQADRLPEYDPQQREIRRQFGLLYIWLHEMNRYHIHRDEQTRIWRLATYLSRNGKGC